MVKKQSKKPAQKKQKFDTALLIDVLRFLFLTLAFYAVMFVTIYSGGSKECAVGLEVESGCQELLPFSSMLLLPSLVLAGLLQAGLKRIKHIKKQIKKLK